MQSYYKPYFYACQILKNVEFLRMFVKKIKNGIYKDAVLWLTRGRYDKGVSATIFTSV